MPKNEQGQLVCVNHPDQQLEAEQLIGLPNIEINDGFIDILKTSTPSFMYFCNECGYMEFYTAKGTGEPPKGATVKYHEKK